MTSGYLFDGLGERRHSRFAVVAFLPSYLERIVAPLREKYDPIYNLIGAHLPLVPPFEAQSSIETMVGRIKEVTAKQVAFRVELSSIGDFYPSDPVVYWRVKDCPVMSDFHRRLYSSVHVSHEVFAPPHVAVAREISYHRVPFVKDKIAGFLPDEHFMLESVDLVTPITGNRWVSVRSLPLLENRD